MAEFKSLFGGNKDKNGKGGNNTSTNQTTTLPPSNKTVAQATIPNDTTVSNTTTTETIMDTNTATPIDNYETLAAESAKLRDLATSSAGYAKQTVKFNFRKNPELGTKRPSIEVEIPVLTLTGLINIIEIGGKQLDLVLSTLSDVIIAQARGQVDDNEAFTPELLDTAAITWEAISAIPKAERKGGGIAKDVWEAFGKDYLTVMPALNGRTLEQTANAVKILLGKFQSCKTNKPVLKYLLDQLSVWFANTTNAEDFADCFEALTSKAEALLSATDEDLLKNL